MCPCSPQMKSYALYRKRKNWEKENRNKEKEGEQKKEIKTLGIKYGFRYVSKNKWSYLKCPYIRVDTVRVRAFHHKSKCDKFRWRRIEHILWGLNWHCNNENIPCVNCSTKLNLYSYLYTYTYIILQFNYSFLHLYSFIVYVNTWYPE